MRAKKYDVGDGRRLTIREICDETGAPLHTVRVRVRRGVRGKRLLDRYKCWYLGLRDSDLDIVADFARRHTVKWTYEKFGVPVGAIRCLLRGETWRVK